MKEISLLPRTACFNVSVYAVPLCVPAHIMLTDDFRTLNARLRLAIRRIIRH